MSNTKWFAALVFATLVTTSCGDCGGSADDDGNSVKLSISQYKHDAFYGVITWKGPVIRITAVLYEDGSPRPDHSWPVKQPNLPMDSKSFEEYGMQDGHKYHVRVVGNVKGGPDVSTETKEFTWPDLPKPRD